MLLHLLRKHGFRTPLADFHIAQYDARFTFIKHIFYSSISFYKQQKKLDRIYRNFRKRILIMATLQDLIEAVIKGDEDKIKLTILELLNAGTSAKEIMVNGLIAGMDIVGDKMETEEMFIPEVLMSAKAMSAGVEILKPQLTDEENAASGIMVIGTVQGDLHDIGKNLVKMLLEGAGFSVIDLGTDVPPAAFVSAIKEHNADIVGMSALLTTTMPKMKETLEAIENAGIRSG
jgi:5-methyltetrahydrofolate--homocysteine methyltransferase